MPIYWYWGEDEFALERAVTTLQREVLDPDWSSFNLDKIPPDLSDSVMQGLNQAMTPPFGAGKRLVWLVETSVGQRCPEEVLKELERTLPLLPAESVLLLTSRGKPDARLKSTKFLQKHAEIREFSPIPGWKTELLVKQVQQAAKEVGVKLTSGAVELLAESVGSDTRQLYTELEKLRLYAADAKTGLDEAAIALLVTATTQNTLKLAAAIRQGQTGEALALVTELLRQNEPALRIVSSLITQFRRWSWIKLMLEAGERDEKAIAQAAEIDNPKRLFFLKKEIESLTAATLMQTLAVLLELDYSLKSSGDDLINLQTSVIRLCDLCCQGNRGNIW